LRTTKAYQIDLKNLSHSAACKFEYLLDNDFFESVDGPEVRKGKVDVSLSVKRVLSDFEMDFQINGVVVVACDRCLDDLEIPITTANRLKVTFGEMYTETSDERIIVSEEEGFINIAWYMYEFIALAIPMKHIHEEGDCNEVMNAKLRLLCVDSKEDNDGEILENDRQTVDPRWDSLRKLVGDN